LTEKTYRGKKNVKKVSVRKYIVAKKATGIILTNCPFKKT
jgi:hypothetical protein